ncbi:unnamed protein product [Paramecium pentaurelia]|uniref:Uncharacterized protein n=1 Tax=Paramecium pentaurelia TaxID=43138 RepID=A0A8S1YGC8_9CILI|nr:unnamed protein product [Paramecium pentaurelia]
MIVKKQSMIIIQSQILVSLNRYCKVNSNRQPQWIDVLNQIEEEKFARLILSHWLLIKKNFCGFQNFPTKESQCWSKVDYEQS